MIQAVLFVSSAL